MNRVALLSMAVMLLVPLIIIGGSFAIQKVKKYGIVIEKHIFYSALLIYCISLCLPVWSVKGGNAIRGFEALSIGWLAIITLDPRWFCNIVLILAYLNIFKKYEEKYATRCFILAALGTTSIFGPYHAGLSMGTFDLFEGTGLTWGGYFWILSLWLFAISAYLKNESNPKLVFNQS